MNDKPPVSAEAQGKVRQLYGQIAADADRITAAVQALPPAMIAAAIGKSPTGSRQALRNIQRRMPVAPVWMGQRGCAWRFLCPLGDTIKVQAVLLGAANRPLISVESFGLNCCRHALGRLLDRTGFAADLVAAMFEAHDSLLALDPPEGRQLFDLPRLPLPAAGGCFLAVPEPMADGAPMLSARTWISADQAFPDQERNLEVWQRFLSNDFAVEVSRDQDYCLYEKHGK